MATGGRGRLGEQVKSGGRRTARTVTSSGGACRRRTLGVQLTCVSDRRVLLAAVAVWTLVHVAAPRTGTTRSRCRIGRIPHETGFPAASPCSRCYGQVANVLGSDLSGVSRESPTYYEEVGDSWLRVTDRSPTRPYRIVRQFGAVVASFVA